MKQTTLRKIKILSMQAVCVAVAARASAQVYSLNIVGYVNVSLSLGDNLIAHQFDDGAANRLNDIFDPNQVPTGSTFTFFDSAAHQFLPASVFDGSSWSINYDFPANGVGGVFHSPVNALVTQAGNVPYVDGATDTYYFVPPTRGPGTYLLATAAPFSDSTFQLVVGRAPRAGDSVETLVGSTQTYMTTTFDGTSWNNGTPSLGAGQSAYFNLVDVPEPSTFALIGVGLVLLPVYRRLRS